MFIETTSTLTAPHYVAKNVPALVSARDIETKRCGKLVLIKYRGEIIGMYPRNTPLTEVVATCIKRHAANTLG